MRTTLTLDDDVAAKLRSKMRKSGRSFKETINAVLRTGLEARPHRESSRRFVVRARPLGLRPGLNYEKVSDLLEQLEGAAHR